MKIIATLCLLFIVACKESEPQKYFNPGTIVHHKIGEVAAVVTSCDRSRCRVTVYDDSYIWYFSEIVERPLFK